MAKPTQMHFHEFPPPSQIFSTIIVSFLYHFQHVSTISFKEDLEAFQMQCNLSLLLVRH